MPPLCFSYDYYSITRLMIWLSCSTTYVVSYIWKMLTHSCHQRQPLRNRSHTRRWQTQSGCPAWGSLPALGPGRQVKGTGQLPGRRSGMSCIKGYEYFHGTVYCIYCYLLSQYILLIVTCIKCKRRLGSYELMSKSFILDICNHTSVSV